MSVDAAFEFKIERQNCLAIAKTNFGVDRIIFKPLPDFDVLHQIIHETITQKEKQVAERKAEPKPDTQPKSEEKTEEKAEPKVEGTTTKSAETKPADETKKTSS